MSLVVLSAGLYVLSMIKDIYIARMFWVKYWSNTLSKREDTRNFRSGLCLLYRERHKVELDPFSCHFILV